MMTDLEDPNTFLEGLEIIPPEGNVEEEEAEGD